MYTSINLQYIDHGLMCVSLQTHNTSLGLDQMCTSHQRYSYVFNQFQFQRKSLVWIILITKYGCSLLFFLIYLGNDHLFLLYFGLAAWGEALLVCGQLWKPPAWEVHKVSSSSEFQRWH